MGTRNSFNALIQIHSPDFRLLPLLSPRKLSMVADILSMRESVQECLLKDNSELNISLHSRQRVDFVEYLTARCSLTHPLRTLLLIALVSSSDNQNFAPLLSSTSTPSAGDRSLPFLHSPELELSLLRPRWLFRTLSLRPLISFESRALTAFSISSAPVVSAKANLQFNTLMLNHK